MPAALTALILLSGLALWLTLRAGNTLAYGDAEAHLEIARRTVDSRTPGYEQIGTVWLPLPHVLMLPLVSNDTLWRTGLAGALPAALAFVTAGLFLFDLTRRSLGSAAAGWTALALFALNPNLLYLQASAMTEPLLFAMALGLLWALVRWQEATSRRGGLRPGWVIAAALFAAGAVLSRYDGWFLLPFAAAAVWLCAPERRWRMALLFTLLAGAAPLYWLAHNRWFYGDALEFFRGPYSAHGIQGSAPYPGKGDWGLSWLYYRTAVLLAVGVVLPWLGLLGAGVAAVRRAWLPVALLAVLPLFYVASLHSGGTPIFLPVLWPHSYYNSRYALAALPLLAFGAAALVAVLPRSRQGWAAVLMGVAGLSPWLWHRYPETWICWKESQVNSDARRAWTHAAAEYLRAEYRPGDGVLLSFGDQAGIVREAGVLVAETLHEGNGAAWLGAWARPDLLLREEWAIALGNDSVHTVMQRANAQGPRYDCVRRIEVKGAPVLAIYRRRDQAPLQALPRT